MEDSKKVLVPLLATIGAFLISQLSFFYFETIWSSFLPGAAVINLVAFFLVYKARKAQTDKEIKETVSAGFILAYCGFLGNVISPFFLKKLVLDSEDFLRFYTIMPFVWISFTLLAIFSGAYYSCEKKPSIRIKTIAFQSKEG